jgi:hypothetical protein
MTKERREKEKRRRAERADQILTEASSEPVTILLPLPLHFTLVIPSSCAIITTIRHRDEEGFRDPSRQKEQKACSTLTILDAVGCGEL